MGETDLRSLLDEVSARELPHVERLTLVAAIVSEALRRRGMRATLVGGGAIEFHAPAAYATTDIDLVVEPSDRRAMEEVFGELGFKRRGRHWVREDTFVEVPGTRMWDPVEEFAVGPFTLHVIRREIALADRVVGYKHWRVTDYGAQAVAMIRAFGEELDESMLRAYLRNEGSEDAYDALCELAGADLPITQEILRRELERLHRGR